jgi:hypothetical protein
MESTQQISLARLLKRGIFLLGGIAAAHLILFLVLRKDTYLQFGMAHACGLAVFTLLFGAVKTVPQLDVQVSRSKFQVVVAFALGVAITAIAIIVLRTGRAG